ncbi:TRP-like ion channel protein (Protein of unknown function, DUF599) [Wolffia australiana]
MKRVVLDFVLVPLGLSFLVFYHVWLLQLIRKKPKRTVLGVNSINRFFWVQSMMQDPAKMGVLAVQSLRNNIMASTLMASTAIMLSSVIAVLMTNSGGWPTRLEQGRVKLALGDVSELGLTIKFFAILSCFLFAFFFEVQSVRFYSHSSILINVPVYVPPEMVAKMLDKGNYFWSLGLRSFYFSFPLFFWIFGPLPMFICCVALVFLLYNLDLSSEEAASKGKTIGEEP